MQLEFLSQEFGIRAERHGLHEPGGWGVDSEADMQREAEAPILEIFPPGVQSQ